jgi:hypothetical protein
MTSTECPHGFTTGCDICGTREGSFVHVSSGGRKYHRTLDCPALSEGRDRVVASGGHNGQLSTLTVRRAHLEGFDPCLTCRPEVPPSTRR